MYYKKNLNDIQCLYKELKNWKKDELSKFETNTKIKNENKKTYLKQVLQSEIEMLQNIDRKKFIINKKQKKDKVEDLLKNLAEARKWLNSHKRYNLVVTPESRRAENLLSLYQDLVKTPLNEVK